MGIRTSGKRVKQQILLNNGKIALCKCDNFVPIVFLVDQVKYTLRVQEKIQLTASRSWHLMKRHDAPKPKETPLKAVPMKGIPVKAVPMRDRCLTDTRILRELSQKSQQKSQYPSRLEKGNGEILLCAEDTSKESFDISWRAIRTLRRSPELRESDGAIFWKTLMYHCKGFERTVSWDSWWLENMCGNGDKQNTRGVLSRRKQ